MTELKFLHSTNKDGQRQVCVTLKSGTSSVQGTLKFQVGNETLCQSVCVRANDRTKVCKTHNSSGTCWVVAKLASTSIFTKKFLNLDKCEDWGDRSQLSLT